MINTISVLAKDADDIINILKKYEDLFFGFNIVKDIFREIGWMILKGCIKLMEWLYILNDKCVELLNFMDSSEVSQFILKLKPFIYTVLLFALCYLAFCFLIAHKKPEGIASNIMIFALVVLVLPWGMTQLTTLTQYGIEVISGDTKGQNCYLMMKPYITDLLYLDSIDFNEKKIKEGNINGYNENNVENIKYLDPTEVLDPSDYELKNEKVFKHELVSEVKDGKETIGIKKIKKKKLLKDITPYYYRYHISFFSAILSFVGLGLVLVFASFKLVLLVYELVMEKIFAPFIAAGDITNGQKIKKLLTGILSGYITILAVFTMQRVYILFSAYVNNKQWVENTAGNTFIRIVLLLIGAYAVIDGPNFFEQIFGIDAGLKSLGQAVQSMYYGSQLAGGIKRGIQGGAQKLAGGAGKVAAGAAGAKGFFDAMKERGRSQNEKVSEDMAGGMPPLAPDLNSALQKRLPGGDKLPQPAGDKIPQPDGGAGAEVNGGNDGIPSGGSNNLKGGEGASVESFGQNNAGINGQINDALSDDASFSGADENRMDNGASANAGINDQINENLANAAEDSGGQPDAGRKTESGLADWAMRNTAAGQKLTAAGQKLTQSYNEGKSLGHATGTTLDRLNEKMQKGMEKLGRMNTGMPPGGAGGRNGGASPGGRNNNMQSGGTGQRGNGNPSIKGSRTPRVEGSKTPGIEKKE